MNTTSTMASVPATTSRPVCRKALSQSFRKAIRAAFSSRVCIAVCAAAVASLFWQELTEQPVSPSLLLALPWAAALTYYENIPAQKGGKI